MTDNNTDDLTFDAYNGEIPIPRTVRFWLLLVSEMISLFASIFLLRFFILDRALRKSLYHHAIVFVNVFALLFKLIDVPLYLNFIVMGKVWPETPTTCLVWWLADLGFYYTCCVLTAWASIERHIFIFHNRWLSTSRRRLLFHYLPLVGIIVYMIIYYTWVIFFPPCKHTYDYTLPVCSASPCYFSIPSLNGWEAGVHGCFTTLVIAVFSIGLLIRVLEEKRRRHQLMKWRKHRKLTIQLLAISSIFLVFNLPLNAGAFIQLCGLPFDLGSVLMPYFHFLSYWLIFLTPIVCVNSLPDLRDKLMLLLRISQKHRATVGTARTLQPFVITRREGMFMAHKNVSIEN